MKRNYEKPVVDVIEVRIEKGFAQSVQEEYQPYSIDGFDDSGETGM